ncbi:hypothetical protein H0H93_014168 [Arthromyces matolae]|nr:hypothetical protein H0H93_014168 [Arthromyces matolae]
MQPRRSILNLFDPLAPSGSRCDTAASSNSDKENSFIEEPFISDHSFFGRSGHSSSPVKLSRRLVDVGDTSIDDSTMHVMLTEEEELDENMCDDDSETLILATLKTPMRMQQHSLADTTTRTPLLEISDPTPIAPSRIYKRQVPSTPEVMMVVPTETSALSSVINAVNAGGQSFASPFQPHISFDMQNDAQPTKEDLGHDKKPQFKITTLNEVDLLPTVTVDPLPISSKGGSTILSPVAALINPVALPNANLRPRGNTFSQNSNRHSIDLCTAFQIQLQSKDASFDLLNDKISFFSTSSSLSSFLDDMEEGDNCHAEQDFETNVASTSPSSQPSAVEGTEESSDSRLPSSQSTPSRSPESPCQREESETCKPVPTSVEPPVGVSPVFSRPVASRNPIPLCTPAPLVRAQTLPPAVPALRIVKRIARSLHEKSASSSSASSAESEGSTTAVSTIEITSQPLAQNTTSTATTVSVPPTHTRLTSSTQSKLTNDMAFGPRRVPITDIDICKRPGHAESKNVVAVGRLNGARRVIVTPSVPIPSSRTAAATAVVPNKTSTVNIVKSGTGRSGMSALPRPVSRLPTASRIVRPPRTGVVASTGGIASIPVDQGNVKKPNYGRRLE